MAFLFTFVLDRGNYQQNVSRKYTSYRGISMRRKFGKLQVKWRFKVIKKYCSTKLNVITWSKKYSILLIYLNQLSHYKLNEFKLIEEFPYMSSSQSYSSKIYQNLLKKSFQWRHPDVSKTNFFILIAVPKSTYEQKPWAIHYIIKMSLVLTKLEKSVMLNVLYYNDVIYSPQNNTNPHENRFP